MNHLRALRALLQQWNAALPLLVTLLGIAIHNGFRQADIWSVLVAVFAVATVYTVAPFMSLLRATAFAPLLLGLVYGCVPYIFGLANIGAVPSGVDYWWLLAILLVTGGATGLAGFRRGNAKHPPAGDAFIAKVGADGACFTSLAAVVIGCVLIIWQVNGVLWLVAMVALFLGMLAYVIIQLADTRNTAAAYNAVITIDTLLHGLILMLATAYILITSQVTNAMSAVLCGLLTAAFLGVFFWFIAKPAATPAARR